MGYPNHASLGSRPCLGVQTLRGHFNNGKCMCATRKTAAVRRDVTVGWGSRQQAGGFGLGFGMSSGGGKASASPGQFLWCGPQAAAEEQAAHDQNLGPSDHAGRIKEGGGEQSLFFPSQLRKSNCAVVGFGSCQGRAPANHRRQCKRQLWRGKGGSE